MQTAASDVRSLSNAEQLVNTVPPTLPARRSLPPSLPPSCSAALHVAVHTWLGQLLHTPAIILFLLPTRSRIIDTGEEVCLWLQPVMCTF